MPERNRWGDRSVPGLAVQVQGSCNAQNQLVADTVKFNSNSLKTATDIQPRAPHSELSYPLCETSGLDTDWHEHDPVSPTRYVVRSAPGLKFIRPSSYT